MDADHIAAKELKERKTSRGKPLETL